MASSLPSPADCCSPCDGEASVQVPGITGAAGTNGTNGTAGVNSFTLLDGGFTMPAELANETVDVDDSTWMGDGQMLFIETAGWMEVQSQPSATQVILKNPEVAASSLYTDNAAPGDPIPTLSKVSPSGLQGPAGVSSSAAPDDATYITVTSNATLTSEVPLDGKGTGLVTFDDVGDNVTVTAIGTADDEQVEVDQAAGLTNGDAVFGTANGIETQAASAARTSLGLGTSAIVNTGVADNEVVTVDEGAGLTSGEIAFATANGIETKTLAAAKAYLGVVAGTTTTTAANPYNLLTTDQTVLHNINGGVLNLPTAVGNDGLQYSIKKIAAGTTSNVITPGVGETIDGAGTLGLAGALSSADIISDGADWHILSTYN